MDESIAEIARAADASKVLRARRMTPAEKFCAGGDLFEEACEWSLAGITARNPAMEPEQRFRELRRLAKLSQSGG